MNNWKNFYKNEYLDSFMNFYSEILRNRKVFKSLSNFEQRRFSAFYFNFWIQTLELLKYFISSNTFMILPQRFVIIYVLNSNIFKNGKLFYDLYLEMKQFKSNKKIISERYWQDNYINLFVEINKFLECRIQKDEAYGVYS